MTKEGENLAKLAVSADDLTGANDTTVQFAKRGIETCVQIDFQQRLLERQENEVIVLNTDSRDMSATQACDTVRHAASVLKAQGIEHIYKKVDSTLRGNFAAEITAVEDVFQPNHAVCEAVPMEGATLVVTGSVSHTTQAQILELLRQPVFQALT